jgi:hypothetical protein
LRANQLGEEQGEIADIGTNIDGEIARLQQRLKQ